MNKKLLFLFVLFAFAVGGTFAQLVWNGEFYTGLEFYAPHGTGEVVRQNHTDHHQAKGPTQFDLTGIYTIDNFGIKLDTLFQDVSTSPVILV